MPIFIIYLLILLLMSLTIETQYKTITNNSEFNLIREYIAPALHFDPRK